MGIKGLSTFVTELRVKRWSQLSNTYVVIDGNNLYNHLYKQFSRKNPNDFLFGGNYCEYQILFEEFFTNLIQCNITPIVVFDGGNNEILNANRMKRFKKKFNLSKRLSDKPPILPLKKSKDVINPTLLKKSLKFVANKMNVICFNTKMDADLEMAKLAIDMDCPLISNDSDFLVMNIKRGVISIDSLKWQTPKKGKKSKHYSIRCEVFKVDDLIQNYYCDLTLHKTKEVFALKLKANMLSIFGSLLAKNGIDEQLLNGLYKEIREQTKTVPLITQEWNSSPKERQMDQLLTWLALCFGNANEAILHIESHLKRNPKDLQLFRESLKLYDTNRKSYLKELLDYKLMATNEEIPINTIVNERQLPNWFLLEYFFGTKYNSLIFSPLEYKTCFKKPLIEDFNLDSTFESNIRLKCFLLGLCRTTRNDETPVHLNIRKKDSFEEILIYPKTHISDSKELPVLSEIQNLSDIERKNLLFDILEFKGQWITHLEEDLSLIKVKRMDIDFWKYFLIVITYWKCNSKMDDSNKCQFISAFVQKLIYFRHYSLIRNDFNGMTSVKYCSRQRFKPFVIHYYCEIQSIYSSIKRLVSLLGDPISGVKSFYYFNGILLYNLFNDIIVKPINSKPFKDDKLNTIYNIIIDSILNANN